MSKHLKLVCLALTVSFSAVHAAEGSKGSTWSGSFVGGYYQSWKKAVPNAHGFIVDRLKTRMDANVSDKTKVVFQTGAFVTSGETGAGGNNAAVNKFSSFNYTSPGAYVLTAGGTNTAGFALALENAYVDHKFSDGFHTWVGFFATPFGMESMWDRADMNSYYYSTFYGNNYVGSGINNDVGIKFALTEMIPGTLEIALKDGRTYSGGGAKELSPSLSLRYSMEHKSGDLSITPVVSVFLGRWAGFSKFWMGSAGVMAKMGALWGNVEFLYGSNQPNVTGFAGTDGKDNRWSLIVEPGFDAGVANVSLKAEATNAAYNGGAASGVNKGNTDLNLGAAVSHTYEGDMTVKLAYAMYASRAVNSSFTTVAASNGQPVNDIRLLFSTKW